jgi:hypothetical protein
VKISINDIEIDLVTCGHCGAVPTEADAQAALNEDRHSPVCAICSQKVKFTDQKLTHHYYDGQHRWMLDGKYEEIVEISHPSGSNWIRSTLHVSCLRKVAPGTQVRPL